MNENTKDVVRPKARFFLTLKKVTIYLELPLWIIKAYLCNLQLKLKFKTSGTSPKYSVVLNIPAPSLHLHLFCPNLKYFTYTCSQ